MSLRFLHFMGVIFFGGFIIYDFLMRILSPGFFRFSSVTLEIFYFFTVPAFLLILVSGILIIVQKPYYFKQEKWLQKKFFLSILIMFILIVGIFPEMRKFAVSSQQGSGENSLHFDFRIFFSSLLTILFFLGNLLISLRHRSDADK